MFLALVVVFVFLFVHLDTTPSFVNIYRQFHGFTCLINSTLFYSVTLRKAQYAFRFASITA